MVPGAGSVPGLLPTGSLTTLVTGTALLAVPETDGLVSKALVFGELVVGLLIVLGELVVGLLIVLGELVPVAPPPEPPPLRRPPLPPEPPPPEPPPPPLA